MADLLGNDIGLNYKGLLNLDTTINTGLDGTLRVVTDGEGDSSPLYLSTTAIGLGTTSIWDNTNGRLGIGTTSPSYKLDTYSTTSGALTLAKFSNVTNTNGAIIAVIDNNYVNFGHGSSAQYNFRAGATQTGINSTNTVFIAIADSPIATFASGRMYVGGYNTSPSAQLDIVAAAATVGLLVKGSDTATFYANIQNDSGTSRFNVGVTGTNVNTRDGSLVVGFTDNSTNSTAGLRLLTIGSGFTYIDGYSDGTSKATNYDIIIGSRRNATGVLLSGNTTAETGTNVQIGYQTATIPSSVLTLNTVTRGFLPPRMTSTQKNAIASPAAGLVIFDTTLAKLCLYTTAWETITSV